MNFRIKPLVWEPEPGLPRYQKALTPFGHYVISIHQDELAVDAWFNNGSWSRIICQSCLPESARTGCEADWQEQLGKVLEPVEEAPKLDIEALITQRAENEAAMVAELASEIEQLHALNVELASLVEDFVNGEDVDHDDDCPGDDTCACSVKPFHDRINDAMAKAEALKDSL